MRQTISSIPSDHGRPREVIPLRHLVEQPPCRFKIAALCVSGDQGGPGEHIPSRHFREHLLGIADAPTFRVGVNNGAGDDQIRQVSEHYDLAVGLLGKICLLQPHTRSQQPREAVMIQKTPRRSAHPGIELDGLAARSLPGERCDHGVPRDDIAVAMAHLFEDLEGRADHAELRVTGEHGVVREHIPLRHSIEQILRILGPAAFEVQTEDLVRQEGFAREDALESGELEVETDAAGQRDGAGAETLLEENGEGLRVEPDSAPSENGQRADGLLEAALGAEAAEALN